MKNTLTLVLFVVVLVASAVPCYTQTKPKKSDNQQTPPAPSQILRGPLAFGLEDGTPIKMRITRTISSADAKVDEKVDFEVLEDIKVGDVIVIPRGGIAWGTVTEAQAKRRMARGGKLNINIDAVRLVSGEKAALRAVKELKGGGHTGAMTGAIVATSIVFFPAAPFFLFMHGKDITIPKGTEITAYINGDVSLDPVKFAAQPVARPTTVEAMPAISATDPSTVAIKSNPDGADIIIDGKFIGNAPSTVRLSPGDHVVRIEKSGFKAWQRLVTLNSGGNITIEGTLEKGLDEKAAGTTTQPMNREKEPEQKQEETRAQAVAPSTTAEAAPPNPKSGRPPAIVYLGQPTSSNTSQAAQVKKIGDQATTDFGQNIDLFLFATSLADHLERCRAENNGDAAAYKKLKDSGKLREVRNHTKVLITNSRKDSQGQDVFEVRVVETGKTVWMDSKFLR